MAKPAPVSLFVPDLNRRALPYKDFLQPALHRRFSSTALVLIAVAYAQSLSLSSWSSWLWAWFPFSSAGFRAMAIFFCGLVIIILRIAQYHIGIRTSNSPFETFVYSTVKQQTAETLFSYWLAGWLYGQVFRWSSPELANLSWITHYSGDRTRLNERPVFLVFYVSMVGILHALLHVFRDNDRLLLGVVQPNTISGEAPLISKTGQHNLAQFYQSLLIQLPRLMVSALTRALITLICSVPIYLLFLRVTAWRLALALFRPFYSLPKSSLPPMAKPFVSTWDYLPRCLYAGVLFSLLLLVSNTAFSLSLVKEPLKDGKPLTADSKDPNGSLLNGLQSKKANVRAFSMWELVYIARDFPDRRAAIFTDIDRKEATTWSQICQVCLDVVKGLEARIAPAPAQSTARATTARASAIGTNAEDNFWRQSKPIKEDNILVATPQKKNLQAEIERIVIKATVDSQTPPRFSPMAKKAFVDARQKLFVIQRDISHPTNSNSGLQRLLRYFLGVPMFGWPFRQRFHSRITAAVLGRPYGEPSVYINAINALRLLAVHSLVEDKFGHVHRDVAGIVRQLTSTAMTLHAFKDSFPLHWTDVEPERVCPEVDAILGACQDALADLVAQFAPYCRDLHLTRTDLRLAEKAVTKGWIHQRRQS